MKLYIHKYLHKQALWDYVFRITKMPWTAEEKLEAIEKHIASHPGDEIPAERYCEKGVSKISHTGLMCTACHSDIDYDAVYCKYCGAKVKEQNNA